MRGRGCSTTLCPQLHRPRQISGSCVSLRTAVEPQFSSFSRPLSGHGLHPSPAILFSPLSIPILAWQRGVSPQGPGEKTTWSRPRVTSTLGTPPAPCSALLQHLPSWSWPAPPHVSAWGVQHPLCCSAWQLVGMQITSQGWVSDWVGAPLPTCAPRPASQRFWEQG